MKRYVTYDIKEGNSYENLYNYFTEIKAVRITESTYETDLSLTLDEFCQKLRSVTSTGDTVVVITRNTEYELMHRFVR